MNWVHVPSTHNCTISNAYLMNKPNVQGTLLVCFASLPGNLSKAFKKHKQVLKKVLPRSPGQLHRASSLVSYQGFHKGPSLPGKNAEQALNL